MGRDQVAKFTSDELRPRVRGVSDSLGGAEADKLTESFFATDSEWRRDSIVRDESESHSTGGAVSKAWYNDSPPRALAMRRCLFCRRFACSKMSLRGVLASICKYSRRGTTTVGVGGKVSLNGKGGAAPARVWILLATAPACTCTTQPRTNVGSRAQRAIPRSITSIADLSHMTGASIKMRWQHTTWYKHLLNGSIN